MAIAPGSRLGPYEVLAPIGEGGMGQVYRARDTRLARDVAIKVLTPSLSRDPERLARFKREALTLASLNHPHVAAVYGLEEAPSAGAREGSGEPAIVMELVEGPTLAERIATGPLPVDEALAIGRQIAEGLEAAHARGIVHRDLKPQNIKLTRGGTVKLLDFGLAKLRASNVDDPASQPDSPTITGANVTEAGTLLGTAAYMAPEQARGEAVDHRADIWSFGCVLYEMLTGRRAFSGRSAPDVLAAILKEDAEWSLLPEATPPPIRRLLRRCLQKPVARRLDSARDAILEFDDALDAAGGQENVRRKGGSWRWSAVMAWLVAGAALAALAVLATRTQPQVAEISKVSVALPQPLADTGRPAIALSPDGSRVAFVAQQGDSSAVFVRSLDGFEATLLPGTEGATSLLFSPDGEWIAFYVSGRLRKISIRGGPPVALASMTDFMGGSWTNSGSIIAATSTWELLSVPDGGGEGKSLAVAQGESTGVRRLSPHVLPGGRAVLLTLAKPQEPVGSVAVRILESGEERILVPAATNPSYVDGRLIFARGATVFAAQFDLQRLEVSATPVPVLHGVSFNSAFGNTQYAVSANGSLAYVPGSAAAARRLGAADVKGSASILNELRHAYYMPRVSPAGGRLAMTILEDGVYSIWKTETLDGRPARLVENAYGPVWSPDGKTIAFTLARDGGFNLAVMAVDGSASPRSVLTDRAQLVPTSWTADGRSVVFTRVDPDGVTGEDIYIVGADGTGSRPLLQTKDNESAGVISPDGKWLAFSIGTMLTGGVAVAPLAEPARQFRVDATGALMPVWSKKGSELFFLAGPRRSRMMTVSVTRDEREARLEKPRFLFDLEMGGGIGFSLPRYDVTADERFVFATAEDTAPASEIRFVLDWAKQLAATPRR